MHSFVMDKSQLHELYTKLAGQALKLYYAVKVAANNASIGSERKKRLNKLVVRSYQRYKKRNAKTHQH